MKQVRQPKEQHFTVNDVAEYCMVSGITVRRWIREGKLSALKLPSGHYRITRDDFKKFLECYDIPFREEVFMSD
jgi:excisionase family DNA binding protein